MDVWNSARGDSGLRFWDSYVSDPTASEASTTPDAFPWNESPTLYGIKLNQHSYLYKRTPKEQANHEGLLALEALCLKIEGDFDCRVHSAYCNRFSDPMHEIPWHRDKFGSHIFVLSLGSPRDVQFKRDGTDAIETHRPKPGDLYFMSLQHNKTHTHRVRSAEDSSDKGIRVSFVFFVTSPFGKPEYALSFWDELVGCFNGCTS